MPGTLSLVLRGDFDEAGVAGVADEEDRRGAAGDGLQDLLEGVDARDREVTDLQDDVAAADKVLEGAMEGFAKTAEEFGM